MWQEEILWKGALDAEKYPAGGAVYLLLRGRRFGRHAVPAADLPYLVPASAPGPSPPRGTEAPEERISAISAAR